MKYCIVAALLMVCILASEVTYPVRCQEVGDSVIGTVTDCDVASDPLPFKWTAVVKLKKTCKWAGLDDVSYIYSNPHETITGDCTTAATLPGTYNKNDNITIQQSCKSFDPPLMMGANLVLLVFYTHHDTFDDVLMFSVPIPGYINIASEEPTPLNAQERQEIVKKIRDGSLRPKKLTAE